MLSVAFKYRGTRRLVNTTLSRRGAHILHHRDSRLVTLKDWRKGYGCNSIITAAYAPFQAQILVRVVEILIKSQKLGPPRLKIWKNQQIINQGPQ